MEGRGKISNIFTTYLDHHFRHNPFDIFYNKLVMNGSCRNYHIVKITLNFKKKYVNWGKVYGHQYIKYRSGNMKGSTKEIIEKDQTQN